MLSPLDFLISFAIAFLCGALVAACHCRHVGKVRRDAYARASEAPVHA
ncbi:hypothetical protein BTM_1561 [Burkholderia thailandensis 34]|nr:MULTISPECIES: hypothetical protein [pseudomallei group]AJY28714.1 hypothetical protein BTM_1561 [Burkholderia thailandensis 34]MBO2962239.1 hypothetical protein [Burkholderia pseudomallei]MBO7788241.1 hypothetical protein [Burkholderia pseudomallei]MBO7841648.1 hypothetical protein [Burkholderia pseudomallei]